MIITDKKQFLALRRAGKKLAEVTDIVAKAAKAGITTAELDALARKEIKKRDAVPSFYGYGTPPFPAALCTSVNHAIVHGIPSDQMLKDGDIVGLDCGLISEGFYTDMAVTVCIGDVDPKVKELVKVTRDALYVGIDAGRTGKRVGSIGAAIEAYAKPYRYGIVKEYCGHGVGAAVHEDPFVPNTGPANAGPLIRHGHVLALEPMLNLGTAANYVGKNHWDVLTRDGKPSAHFEHTVLYLEGKDPFVITELADQEGDDGSFWADGTK